MALGEDLRRGERLIPAIRSRPYRLTIVHPCVGRHVGMKRYVRTWMMEPLQAGMVAALAPSDVERRFYDDRLETIPYDEPTDLVAISVETYTARRAYQIASAYRRRGVPVLMGGFHATLCPNEVSEHCESMVIGQAEEVLPEVIDDHRHGRGKRVYRSTGHPRVIGTPDRTIFRGKRYLPMRLVESSRGCRFKCDFCSVTSFYEAEHAHRDIDQVLAEVQRVRRVGQMVFFVDDNFTSNLARAKELMKALIPLKIRWVSQSAINVAHDEEALELMRRSGCQGLLVGFESLQPATLQAMNKDFNLVHGGAAVALENFRRHGLRIYGSFVFGYDQDTPETFQRAQAFARDEGLFIAAFAHVIPFPGTPLLERLRSQGRLLHDPWWLDPAYRFNLIPFRPTNFSPEELAARCLEARRTFYSWRSILGRAGHRGHRDSPWVLANFLAINFLHRIDVDGRNGLPLGDAADQGEIVRVRA